LFGIVVVHYSIKKMFAFRFLMTSVWCDRLAITLHEKERVLEIQ